jgi:hypothetical protein
MTSKETKGVVEELVSDVEMPKRASVSLTAGEHRMTILAQRKKDGTAVVTVTTVDAAKKALRGMTKRFESLDLAKLALGKLEQDAVSKGWKKSVRSGGFKAKPDAFSAMPVAPDATRSSRGKK